MPFIRARLTIQCDSWTSAKPSGGKTMPSKLEQMDKGTPFSRDFLSIISFSRNFLTIINEIYCVFYYITASKLEQMDKGKPFSQYYHLFLVIFLL